MKTGYEILSEQKFLLYSIIAIGFIFLAANLFEQENYPVIKNWYVTDILYFIIPALGILLGALVSIKYRGQGNHGKAWILLTLAMVSWYAAELTFVYNNEYDVADITTFTSDVFYILGYPLLFGFGIFYLKARKKIISKQMILTLSAISLALLIPSLYISFAAEEEQLETIEIFLTIIYPILDSFILIPALIGVVLFLRGQVNILWALMIIGILSFVAGDTLYMISYIDDSYYPGHISDMFFQWGYVLFVFSFYNYFKIYKKEPMEKLEN